MHRILDTFMTPRRVDSLITVQESQYDAPGNESHRHERGHDGADGAAAGHTAGTAGTAGSHANANANADARMVDADAADDDDGGNGEGNTTLDFAPKARRTPFASAKRMTPGRKFFRSIGTPRSATPAKLAFSPVRPSLAAEIQFPGPPSALEEEAEPPTADTEEPEAVDDAETLADAVNDDDNEDGDDDDDDDADQYEIKRLLSHRWATPYSLEIEVEWATLETTWEPERALHEDCPALLFAHWAAAGGRPANPEDPNLFEVFSIRRHSANRRRFLVEWVGYPPGEASWLSREALEETDGDIVTEYWDRVDAQKGKRGRRRRKR
ncbi:hypothetical protein ESCO_005785 [Escovopsis weberi]|uniref:Chromo domain-containing protein n=1 Tax=Escovopsis weberi TaxID=150374 RepID=A0A0M8N3F5_ESCWE|nr:hypothetical protein ESCO_005785 [Escovopsis weberi]